MSDHNDASNKESSPLKAAQVASLKKEETTPSGKSTSTSFLDPLYHVYEKHYKLLLIIPFALLFFAIVQVGVQTASTGTFIHKGISLSGGVAITAPAQAELDVDALAASLASQFPGHDINVRSIDNLGTGHSLVVEADIDENDHGQFNAFFAAVQSAAGISHEEDMSVEFFGSSLGASFFSEIFKTMIVAFIFMGIVVFIMFRTFIPSTAVILACFSDIIVTIAVLNIMEVKIGTAGVAAFLMLIGYSVDTDILLSSRVLKRDEGTVLDRVYGSMKTGLMMTATALAVTIIAFIFSNSETLRQIMLIVTIGLVVDMVFTWIQNAGILRWYLEAKQKKTNA